MQKRFLELNGKQLEPNEFNNQALTQLQIEHSVSLKRIYARIKAEFLPSRILDKYKSKFERHLFPALTLASELDVIDDNFIDYCAGFVGGYSIPVLMLDEVLDSNIEVEKENLVYIYRSLYKSEKMICALPNGKEIVQKINSVYDMVTTKLIDESQNRYKFPELDFLKNHQISRDPNKYHRSVCGYFTAVVEGVFTLNNITLSPKAEELLKLFGILRQLTNEIGDVEEDLRSGIITMPVILTLAKEESVHSLISSYWKLETGFQPVENAIIETGSYNSCFNLSVDLYNDCLKLKNELSPNYPALNKLFIFYDLKLCVLYRLEENFWRDNYKKYC